MKFLRKQALFSKIVLLVFFSGLLISIFLYQLMKNNIELSNQKDFEHLVERNSSSIQQEMDTNLEILNSVTRFYNSSTHVSREEFKIFVEETILKYKSIQALEWIPNISHDLRKVYEQKASNELKIDYHIKEKYSDGNLRISEQKSQYFPVYYVEPLKGNEKALGFDLASNSTRLKSLIKSKKLKKNIATAKIKLVQEKGEKSGILIFSPIWNNNNSEKLDGFVLGVYKIDDIINNALRNNKLDSELLNIWMADITDENKNEFLFSNTQIKKIIKTNTFVDFNVYGRVWRLYLQPSENFIEQSQSLLPFVILSLCTFVTFLISYITALKVSREHDLKDLVKDKMKDLRDANKKYESLLEMFDKNVIASKTDLKGKITYVTEAFCKISGYTKEELLGRNHNIVRHEDMPKELYARLWKTIKNGEIFKADIKNKKKNGEYYWVNVQIEPEMDKNKNIIAYSATREDITAKKQIEEFNKMLANKIEVAVEDISKKDKLLLQQSKLAAMGEMIGAIAHQWRQPLNTLAIKIQFLEDDFEDGLINEEYLEEYSNENMKLINFMSKTIDDFRNFFTIDKDQIKFSIKSRILETTNMLKAQFENANIKLNIKGDDFYTIGYANEFQQVILNIVNNAKDVFIEKEFENGNIDITIETKENKGFIKIKDNAGGIPKDILNRVFEPYFTTKEQSKGTGLGLYMSKMIIEDNMDGTLNVKNIVDGVEFIIEIGVSND